MSELFKVLDDEVPFGPAAGAISGQSKEEIKSKVKDVMRSPTRAAWWGSLSWNRSLGNSSTENDPTYYHNTVTGITGNNIGLNNLGHEEGIPLHGELQEIADDAGKDLIPSLSPGRGEDAREVLPAMAYKLRQVGAKIIEINYSCFNKLAEGGGREEILGYDPYSMFEVDEKIVEAVGTDIWIIRKPPPYIGKNRQLIPEVIYGFARARGRVALSVCNTLGQQRVVTERGDPALGGDNVGSISGPGMCDMGREQLDIFRAGLPDKVRIISCLGITTGQEVAHRICEQAADFTAGVTVFIENEKLGISYGQTITQIAEEYGHSLANEYSFS